MKQYKRILEAVQRGINLALDDFDSELVGQLTLTIKDINHTKDYLEWQLLISKLENEELTKQDIEELARISKSMNLKYTVNSTGNLEDIVDYIDKIDHNANLNWIDTSKLTNMSFLFNGKEAFNGNISEWNVSNVENMRYMFANCISFNQPLNNWDVSKVKYMQWMFCNCSSFNQPLNNWNVSNVENMRYMFEDCISFNQPLNNWGMTNVQETMNMFKRCPIKKEYKPFNNF